MSRRRRWLLSACLGMLLPACSVVLDVSEPQCSTDQECVDRGFQGVCVNEVCTLPSGSSGTGMGGAAATPWGCLGNVMEPPIQPGTKVNAEFRILLASAESPPPNTSAYVCSQIDVNCTNPTAGPLSPDGMGKLRVELPSGFEGYLKIDSPSTVPSLVFIGRPIVTVPKTNTVRLLTTQDFEGLASLAGQVPDPMRGHALILVTDCLDLPAANVEVNSMDGDAETKKFYLIGTLPRTDLDRTDQSGFAGFFNVPPGIISVEARRAEDDKPFVGKYGFRIQEGTISYLLLGPTPGG